MPDCGNRKKEGQGEIAVISYTASFIVRELYLGYLTTFTVKLYTGVWRSDVNFKKLPLVELQIKYQYD